MLVPSPPLVVQIEVALTFRENSAAVVVLNLTDQDGTATTLHVHEHLVQALTGDLALAFVQLKTGPRSPHRPPGHLEWQAREPEPRRLPDRCRKEVRD